MTAEPTCRVDNPEPSCVEDVHAWFSLTYASYLVLPRSLMQAMPAEWQHSFVRLLDDMRETFVQENDNYMVTLRRADGTFVEDPLRGYRHTNHDAIAAARERARI